MLPSPGPFPLDPSGGGDEGEGQIHHAAPKTTGETKIEIRPEKVKGFCLLKSL